jgi:hypothetical protein
MAFGGEFGENFRRRGDGGCGLARRPRRQQPGTCWLRPQSAASIRGVMMDFEIRIADARFLHPATIPCGDFMALGKPDISLGAHVAD